MFLHLCRKASPSVAVGLVAASRLVVEMGAALGVGRHHWGLFWGWRWHWGVLHYWRWPAALEVAPGVTVSLGGFSGGSFSSMHPTPEPWYLSTLPSSPTALPYFPSWGPYSQRWRRLDSLQLLDLDGYWRPKTHWAPSHSYRILTQHCFFPHLIWKF